MKRIIFTLLAAGLTAAAADEPDPGAAAPRADWHQEMQSSYTWNPQPAPDPDSAPLNPSSYLKSPVSEDSSDLDTLRLILSDSTDAGAHSLVPSFRPSGRPSRVSIGWGPLWALSRFHPTHSPAWASSLRSLDPSHALKHPLSPEFQEPRCRC